MTNPLNRSELSDDQRRLVDTAKNAFQWSWQHGREPQIATFSNSFPESMRLIAFSELLELEIRLRRENGESPAAAEYIKQFPEHTGLIVKLVEQASATDKPVASGAMVIKTGADAEKIPKQISPKVETDTIVFDPQSIPEDFGRYQILRQLGKGGMGAVYLAIDQQLDRKVALKIPFFRDDDEVEAVERFYREARAMATVQHANLCPIYDVGRFEQWHFLTMAYIDGQSLSQILKQSGVLEVPQAATLLKTVAGAVQKAHDAGIVHRDLKPGNIMLTRDFEPIIMDFGLAQRRKAGEVELTHTGAVFGSPAYMAPEQVEARHEVIGPATDVYALGVILYQMVTGRRPFEGSSASVFGQIVSRTPDAPSTLRPGLPTEIDSICLKALAKSPSQRHASAAAFSEDVSRLLRNTNFETRTVTFQSGIGGPSVGTADGDPISISRSRRDAELRQVTVAIFNYESDDSSISTSRSSHSELLHERSQSFATYVGEHVAKLGGVTVKVSGPDVIACFGFPQAFEDSPQRAVRAALQALRDLSASQSSTTSLPSANHTWVVLHSGEAVAEEIEDTQGGGISLVGDARNMAMRLNSVAEPGTITISAATHQRVAVYFECESLEPQRVRGISQPVELFQVLKERPARNRVELIDPGNLTPLVGRDTELLILKERWEQAIDGLGQIVLLIGDAGLGKSRLIRELREHVIDAELEAAAVIEWRCSQYQQGTSFFPVIEFLSRLLNFENLGAAERLESLVRYLNEWELASEENVALLAALLGIPADTGFPALALTPQKMKEHTETLLLKWLRQLVQANPLLFIVEDLHWLDPSTLELLEKHVSEFEMGRMLSLLTFRPEFETPWKSKPHLTQIALNRLTKRQIGEMMRKRTQRREIPEVILQQVIERTEGIPLFVEEFTVVIIESGILDRTGIDPADSSLLHVIPASLNDLLVSRLDRMAADREVIQLAATIGREFGFKLLSFACTLPSEKLQSELDTLVNAEILFKKGEGSEAQYIFKHALLQDAAYRSMLTKKRQACHKRIAEVIEAHFEELVHSQPALLAHHFTEAGDKEKAISYWLKAGQKSQEQSANVEAIQQFQHGVALTATLEASPSRDLLELSLKLPLGAAMMAVHGYAAKEVEPVQNRCIDLCRQLGEGAPLFPVLIANWEWLFIRGRFQDCYERCAEVIRIARSVEGPGMIAEAEWTLVCTSMYAGDFPSTKEHAEICWRHFHRHASIEYSKITQQNSGPLSLVHWGYALWMMGYPDQAFVRMNESLDLTYDLKHVFTQAVMEWKAAQLYEFALIADKAIEHGKRSRQIGDEQGFPMWQAMGTAIQGIGLKLLGRFDEAIENLRTGMAIMQATGAAICLPKYQGQLADALWQAGQREAAVQMLQTAFDSQASGGHYVHAELLRIRGDFECAEGKFEQAEATYHEALAVAVRQGARMFELRTTVRLGRLWQAQGHTDKVRPKLEPLVNWFTEGFEMPDLKAAKALLSEI